MIEKNKEYTPEDGRSKVEDKDESSNFKFLYRNPPSPERDKSSGVSSDEETTSSSLVPIPETLKYVRNKSKWTINDADHSGLDNSFAGRKTQNCSENLIDSLEELRRKYTLKTETSVALKMNSANMMLDDILSRSNLLKVSSETQFAKDDYKKNESSTPGDTLPHCGHAIHPVPNLCHKVVPPFYNSLKSEKNEIKKDLGVNNKKKTLAEKLHDLHIKYKLKSVYKTLQKATYPFSKNRKIEDDGMYKTGIPGSDYHIKETRNNCELRRIYPQEYTKNLTSNLVECSNVSDTKSIDFMNDRGEKQCTCLDFKNKCMQSLHLNLDGCTCPKQTECLCSERSSKIIKNSKTCSQSEFLSETPHTPRQDQHECSVLSKDSRKSSSNIRGGWKKYCYKERNLIEKIDFYYFDHGNSAYYQTTDHHPVRYTECLVECTDEYATQFWAEIFGTIEIGVAFLISFILQFYRFFFSSIIRSLLVGFIQVFSDYFFKPLLTIIFNGIIQPCLILGYNIATSFRDLCLPISQTFGFFAKEVANVFKSCKLVDVRYERVPQCSNENKV